MRKASFKQRQLKVAESHEASNGQQSSTDGHRYSQGSPRGILGTARWMLVPQHGPTGLQITTHVAPAVHRSGQQ